MTRNNKPTDRPKDGEPKKILIVEDNRSHRSFIDKILETLGFATEHAKNGMDALAKLQRGERFNLIIMDLDMPHLDGLDTTRAIRGREKIEGQKPTPIMAFTGNDNAAYREECLAAGMNGYLPKDVWMPGKCL